MTTKLTTYVSDLTIRVGPMATKGRLVSVQKSDAKSSKPVFSFVTPDGAEVERVFRDADTGEIYEQDQLLKQEVISFADKEDGKTGAIVSQEQIDATKAAQAQLPKNVVKVSVHDKAEVESFLYPSKHASFVFQPDSNDPADEQWYNMIVELVRASDKAFVAVANIKNHEGLYRLLLWNDKLVLQRQSWPEDLNDVPTPETEFSIDETTLGKGLKAIDKLTETFDPDTYRNRQGEALAALTEAVKAGNVVVAAPEKAKKEAIDLGSILDAFGELD